MLLYYLLRELPIVRECLSRRKCCLKIIFVFGRLLPILNSCLYIFHIYINNLLSVGCVCVLLSRPSYRILTASCLPGRYIYYRNYYSLKSFSYLSFIYYIRIEFIFIWYCFSVCCLRPVSLSYNNYQRDFGYRKKS